MVTWLKKFSYSKEAKSIAIILLSIAILGMVQGILIMVAMPSENSYYETWRFEDRFIEKAGFVRDWIVRYADEEIFNPEAIAQADVDKRIKQSPELREYIRKLEMKRIKSSSQDIKGAELIGETTEVNTPEHQETTTVVVEGGVSEADFNYQEIEYEEGTIGYRDSTNQKVYVTLKNEERLALEQEARAGIINDRKQYYGIIQTELKGPNVKYLAFEKGTDKVITNEERYDGTNKEEVIEIIKGRPVYIKGNGVEIQNFEKVYRGFGGNNYIEGYQGNHHNYYEGQPFPEQNNYAIYVSMQDELVPGDYFYEEKLQFDRTKEVEPIGCVVGIGSLVLAIAIGLYGLKVIGKEGPEDQVIAMSRIDRVPFEIQWGIAICSLFLWFLVLVNGVRGSIIPYDWIPYTGLDGINEGREIIISVVLYIMLSIGMGIGLIPLTSLIRHIKNGSMGTYILSIRLSKWTLKSIVNGIKEDTLILWTIGAMIVYVSVNGFLVILILNSWGGTALVLMAMMLMFNIIVALGIFKLVIDYIYIAKASQRITEGDLDTKVELKNALPLMKRMADNLNNIGQGLEEAVANTVKSERLKTELITNVSHDLKTPLTSIISYIDLLKDEEIGNPVAEEYIEVLSERSNRLKLLVEDLVEASKAATGNIKSELTSVELSQLVVQAVGEYSDRLEKQGLEVVMNPLEEVNVLADGRHMWRVIENLLSNVSKYAMPHTRVYIEVRKEKTQGKLVIKNISKESLHLLDPSELTERFVRGDDSRTTEGSGLGLAIAQSLIAIQGGQFKIELDGDLFKVEILMPEIANK